MNENVVDLFTPWKFNKFGFASSVDQLFELALQSEIDLSGAKLFFYCVYEYELESDGWTFDPNTWQAIAPSKSSYIEDEVLLPGETGQLATLGFDVVTFGGMNEPEHSPLSCNSIATQLTVNQFCLFNEFEEAKKAIDEGKFGGGCEDGLYRILSVTRVDGWKF